MKPPVGIGGSQLFPHLKPRSLGKAELSSREDETAGSPVPGDSSQFERLRCQTQVSVMVVTAYD